MLLRRLATYIFAHTKVEKGLVNIFAFINT